MQNDLKYLILFFTQLGWLVLITSSHSKLFQLNKLHVMT
jgi:hypothetical protein